MGSGLCPVGGFCDRGNELSVYTKWWSFLSSCTTVGFSRRRQRPAASLAMRTRYGIVTDSQIGRVFGSGEVRTTSRYNTGLGLMKTEVNREG